MRKLILHILSGAIDPVAIVTSIVCHTGIDYSTSVFCLCEYLLK